MQERTETLSDNELVNRTLDENKEHFSELVVRAQPERVLDRCWVQRPRDAWLAWHEAEADPLAAR